MVDNQFFDESREQSQIKARIVAKYFWAWAKVVIPSTKKRGNRIAYIDLFADDQFLEGRIVCFQRSRPTKYEAIERRISTEIAISRAFATTALSIPDIEPNPVAV